MTLYAKNVFQIAKTLRSVYQDFNHNNKKHPLDELLFILCSVKTTQNNYTRTYSALRKAFPRYDMLLDTPEKEIAKVIIEGGLSNQKARSIKLLIGAITKKFGRPTLAPLKHMTIDECEYFLTLLPGIGKKVANCIMMYSLGWEVFPVDTHCWRICRRLGWVRPTKKDKTCSRKDMDRLQSKIPPQLRFSLHVNIISLGREVCTAHDPKCWECPIEYLCPKIGVRKNNTGSEKS